LFDDEHAANEAATSARIESWRIAEPYHAEAHPQNRRARLGPPGVGAGARKSARDVRSRRASAP
jgi:hypothetical protein